MLRLPPDHGPRYRKCYRMLPLCYRSCRASGNILHPQPFFNAPSSVVHVTAVTAVSLRQALKYDLARARSLEPPAGPKRAEKAHGCQSETPRARGRNLVYVCVEKCGNTVTAVTPDGRSP
jgi:hypothetical protein